MTHEATCNAAFRRHHMGRLLHRIGTLLPQWLNGPDLVRGCRDLEQLCWRELGCLSPINLQIGSSSPMPRTLTC